MGLFGTVFLRIILVPFVGLVCSHAMLAAAHASGWFPELQLSRLLLASPSILEIEWVRWALIAFITTAFWGVADYIFYRRHHRAAGKRTKPSEPQGQSKLDWDFEREAAFIGMSAGPEQQILIHNFQARGRNNTGDPIASASGFIRSDQTSCQFPLLFNIRGKATPSNQINPIPVGATIDTQAAFSDDGKPITIQKFLTEIVPFTFFFEYDGKSVRRTVNREEVEKRIDGYGKTIRDLLVRSPEITARESSPTPIYESDSASTKGQQSRAALDATLKSLSFAMDGLVDRLIYGPTNRHKDRISLVALRERAELAGWCSDIQAVTVGDNDWWTFSTKLRQAAVDGHIQFWGRRNINGWANKDTDSTPLTKISSEHFEKFEFDCTQLAQCDNYDIFTSQLGHSPDAFRGQNYRDIYVDTDDAKKWLEVDGHPPPSADFHITLDTTGAPIGNFTPIVAIAIVGLANLEGCIASIEQMNHEVLGLPIPLVLRTDGQTRDNRKGRWRISKGQSKVVPIIFRGPVRQNEWFFIHETGEKYFMPAGPLEILIGVYGGKMDGKVLLKIEVGTDWRAYPSIETVDEKHRINAAELRS